MTLKFRKRISPVKGLTLNVSKSGLSSTIGIKGLGFNIGKNGAFLNIGLPGSGIYDRIKINSASKSKHNSESSLNIDVPTNNYVSESIEKEIIKSAELPKLSSEMFSDIRQTLEDKFCLHANIEKEILEIKNKIQPAHKAIKLSNNRLWKLLFSGYIEHKKNQIIEYDNLLHSLDDSIKDCFIDINFSFEIGTEIYYQNLVNSFQELINCSKKWDVISKLKQTSLSSIERKPIDISLKNIEIIKSEHNALYFQNANGGDLYFYPCFVIIINDDTSLAIIDIKDIQLHYTSQTFIESEDLPLDAKVLKSANGKTEVMFGKINIQSKTGLNEEYLFSDCDAAKKFAQNFIIYQNYFNNSYIAE